MRLMLHCLATCREDRPTSQVTMIQSEEATPVLPTTPQVVPASMQTSSPLSTRGSPGRYLILTPLNSICIHQSSLQGLNTFGNMDCIHQVVKKVISGEAASVQLVYLGYSCSPNLPKLVVLQGKTRFARLDAGPQQLKASLQSRVAFVWKALCRWRSQCCIKCKIDASLLCYVS